MTGHIRQRSPGSWEVRWRHEGRVCTRTIKGSKKDAERALRAAIPAVEQGNHIDPSRITVAELLASRIEAWHASGKIRNATRDLYLTAAKTAAPIGSIPAQKLTSADIERWHLDMHAKDLSTSARRAAHGVVHRALADAVRHRLAVRNAAADQGPPPAGRRTEVAVLKSDQVQDLLTRLDGDAWRVPVVMALHCGLRRSEQLALRWHRIDLDRAKVQIVEALEESRTGIVVKPPKTKAGTRTISLPKIVVAALREHRKAQLERCLLLGQGRPPADAIVFPGPGGGYDGPRAFSLRWGRAAARMGIPEISWHSLRHAHAAQLVAAGVPITTITARLGHADASVTLKVYAYLYEKDDSAAAAAIDAALG